MQRRLLPQQPAGLSTLFFAELWERFSYYGMRALLTLFMVAPAVEGGLGFSDQSAAVLYGNYTMAVYLLAIPGGFIADRFIGAKGSVLIGGAIIALGHFSLAVPSTAMFYVGLVQIALGTGLFKPNISALVGQLYRREDVQRDSGFSIFYMGINIGGFVAPLVTGFLAQSAWFKAWLAGNGFDPNLSWHWGFGAAGVGMTVALVILAMRRSRYAAADVPGQLRAADLGLGLAVVAGSGVLLAALLLSDRPELAFLRYVLIALPLAAIVLCLRQEDIEARRVAAVFVFFVAAMIFWAAFEQAGLTLALFADRLTDNEVAGWTIPSAWYQSLNPLFVIALAPVFAIVWSRQGERQPSTPAKFVAGLFFLTLSFAVMVPAAQFTAGGRVSPLWLVLHFLLITIGELCLSPVGLSAMTKLAPPRLVGLMLGVWFLAAAFGNKLAGVLGAGFESEDPRLLMHFFLSLAAMGGGAAVAMLVLMPWIKRLMGGIR